MAANFHFPQVQVQQFQFYGSTVYACRNSITVSIASVLYPSFRVPPMSSVDVYRSSLTVSSQVAFPDLEAFLRGIKRKPISSISFRVILRSRQTKSYNFPPASSCNVCHLQSTLCFLLDCQFIPNRYGTAVTSMFANPSWNPPEVADDSIVRPA